MNKDLFWSKVDKSGDCWLWTGATTSGGYGNFGYTDPLGKRRYNSPHRLLWIELYGPIPSGLEVDHKCHDPASCSGGATCPHRRCVKPAHLILATPKRTSKRELRSNV